jgi:hypothetical protein
MEKSRRQTKSAQPQSRVFFPRLLARQHRLQLSSIIGSSSIGSASSIISSASISGTGFGSGISGQREVICPRLSHQVI